MDQEELEFKLAELATKVEDLEQEKQDRELDNFQLKYPLDDKSKKIIEDTISDKILDIAWGDYIYINPFHADLGRFLVAGGGSLNFAYTSTGLNAQTAASTDSFDAGDLLMQPTVISFDNHLRLRVSAEVNSVSSIDAAVYTLAQGTDIIGFQFLNGVLQGFSTNSAGTTTAQILSSYAVDTSYTLELRYYPKEAVRFYLNDIETTSISSNLPIGDGSGVVSMFGMSVATGENVIKSLEVSYADIIQRKK